MLRKIIGIVGACIVMVVSLGITTFAAEGVTKEDNSSVIMCTGPHMSDNYYENISRLPYIVRYENSTISNRAASIKVNIQSPLEVSWRNAYSDYYYQANAVVEAVDDRLYAICNIDFYTISQPFWDVENVAIPSVAMNILKRTHGKGNADIMLAFAGPLFDSASSVGYGMTSALGEPYCIVFDHGQAQNNKSALHEIGHAYGLEHCSKTCVMKQGQEQSGNLLFKNMCSTHTSQLKNSKNKY